MLRVHIEEIGGDSNTQRKAAIEEVQKSQSEAKRQITSKDNQMFEKFTSGESKSTVKNQIGHQDYSKSSVCDKNSSTNNTSVKLDLKSLSDKSEESKSVSPRSLPIPQSSFQFQTDYKVLKNDLQSFYCYVRVSNHYLVCLRKVKTS